MKKACLRNDTAHIRPRLSVPASARRRKSLPLARKKRKQTATAILRMLPDSIPGNVAKTLNIHGGIKCNVQACATGAGAVSDALDSIQLGRAAVVLAGGVEAFSKTAHDAFALLGATTARNTDPQLASRPFDRGRDGFGYGRRRLCAGGGRTPACSGSPGAYLRGNSGVSAEVWRGQRQRPLPRLSKRSPCRRRCAGRMST